jgi:acyl carrier protein
MESTEVRVRAVVLSALEQRAADGIAGVTDEHPLKQPPTALDSLEFFDLLAEVSESLGVELGEEDLRPLFTLGGLVRRFTQLVNLTPSRVAAGSDGEGRAGCESLRDE